MSSLDISIIPLPEVDAAPVTTDFIPVFDSVDFERGAETPPSGEDAEKSSSSRSGSRSRSLSRSRSRSRSRSSSGSRSSRGDDILDFKVDDDETSTSDFSDLGELSPYNSEDLSEDSWGDPQKDSKSGDIDSWAGVFEDTGDAMTRAKKGNWARDLLDYTSNEQKLGVILHIVQLKSRQRTSAALRVLFAAMAAFTRMAVMFPHATSYNAVVEMLKKVKPLTVTRPEYAKSLNNLTDPKVRQLATLIDAASKKGRIIPYFSAMKLNEKNKEDLLRTLATVLYASVTMVLNKNVSEKKKRQVESILNLMKPTCGEPEKKKPERGPSPLIPPVKPLNIKATALSFNSILSLHEIDSD